MHVCEWGCVLFVCVSCLCVCVCVCVSVYAKSCKYILLDTWILLECVNRQCAETGREAADSSVRWSDSLSGKFTLHYAVLYTVG